MSARLSAKAYLRTTGPSVLLRHGFSRQHGASKSWGYRRIATFRCWDRRKLFHARPCRLISNEGAGMTDEQAMVEAFHSKFGILTQTAPMDVNEETKQLRVRLIQEEFDELQE